ncbi:ligase-associated DNA damage response exonuclease [Rhodovibrionaceae bacterium A322]
MKANPESWLAATKRGLYCIPGDFYVDPTATVERAVITHGHADHARPGHQAVLSCAPTLDMMKVRYGARAGNNLQSLSYGQRITLNGVTVWLAPAGHVLGSAQVVMEYQGCRVIAAGDYKRRNDPTAQAFEPVACDVFITEATFGLPVYRHPAPQDEMAKLLASLQLFPTRSHLVGAYSLGKAQRFIALLRQAGYDAPVYIHKSVAGICALYETHGVRLGDLRPLEGAGQVELCGAVVIAPPGGKGDGWVENLSDPVVIFASGWMRLRQRAMSQGVELPLILSDHADWDELTQTFLDVEAPEIWVTHGKEDALVRQARTFGLRARALSEITGAPDMDNPDLFAGSTAP